MGDLSPPPASPHASDFLPPSERGAKGVWREDGKGGWTDATPRWRAALGFRVPNFTKQWLNEDRRPRLAVELVCLLMAPMAVLNLFTSWVGVVQAVLYLPLAYRPLRSTREGPRLTRALPGFVLGIFIIMKLFWG